jgi:hypothetical protein
MSKKRRQHDGERDPVVSEAYRELSQERTPAHLDHVVLNAARKAAKADRPREISWLRPAAWVTTIGLCLAIVLEITDPAPQDDAAGAPTSGHKELRGDAPALRQKRAETRATSVEEIPSRDEDVASVADSPLPTAAGREAAEALPGMPAEERKNVATPRVLPNRKLNAIATSRIRRRPIHGSNASCGCSRKAATTKRDSSTSDSRKRIPVRTSRH